MSDASNPSHDFETLARQYWNAWTEMLRAPQAAAPVPGFKEGLAWWSQLAGRNGEQVEAAVERMNAQAGGWFGAMQQLAASFAGRDAAPQDISRAWQHMLGGANGNAVADMFRRMGGNHAHGVESWLAQVQPWLAQGFGPAGMGSAPFAQGFNTAPFGASGFTAAPFGSASMPPIFDGLRAESDALLRTPAFGLAREHQERIQHFMRAQLELRDRLNDYNGQLAAAGKRAFERFESKLGERSEPGRQIESARALFDLWIDAAEEAWAEIAMSAEFRRVYGDLVNALMRVRAGVQAQIEQAAQLFGLPTRSELDGSHKKVTALERELRALKTRVTELEMQAGPVAAEAAASSEPAPARAVKAARAAAASDETQAPRVRERRPAKRAAARAETTRATAPRKNVLPKVALPQGFPRSNGKKSGKGR